MYRTSSVADRLAVVGHIDSAQTAALAAGWLAVLLVDE